MDNLEIKNSLIHYNYRPLFYYNLMKKLYKDEWLEWDPVVIEITLRKEFGLDNIDDGVIDCICALMTILNSNIAYTDPNTFEKIVIAICNPPVDFEITLDPSASQVSKTVRVMQRLKPEQDFSREVKMYIAFQCWEDGIFIVPDELRLVEDELRYILQYKKTYNGYDEKTAKELWDAAKNMSFNEISKIEIPENKFAVLLYKLLTIRNVTAGVE